MNTLEFKEYYWIRRFKRTIIWLAGGRESFSSDSIVRECIIHERACYLACFLAIKCSTAQVAKLRRVSESQVVVSRQWNFIAKKLGVACMLSTNTHTRLLLGAKIPLQRQIMNESNSIPYIRHVRIRSF